MEPPERPSADDPIRDREARGLLGSLGARLLYVGLFGLLTTLRLLGTVRLRIAAETDREAVGTLAIQLLALACIVFFTYHARRRTHRTMVGAGATVLDVVLIACPPRSGT